MVSGGPSPSRDAAVRRDAFGQDLDEATAFYERLHNAHHVDLTATGEPFSYRMRTVGDSSMMLRSSTLTADRWGRIEPEGHYLLTWAQHGVAAIDAGTDEEQLLRPGMAAMYPAGRAFTLQAPAGAVLHAVEFDAAFLEELDATRNNAETWSLRFRRDPDPRRLSALQQRLAATATQLLSSDTDPLRRRMLARGVGSLVLDAFVAADDRLPKRYGRKVEQALQFIEDQTIEPVTPLDAAAAVGLSLRGLQQAFERERVGTPSTVIRRARLRDVRSVLQHAHPGEESVSAVARAHGFRHMGRFAGYYELEFGELPSSTLRARRTS